jgi:hypothetical protein
MLKRGVSLDLRPEYCQYEDYGCELSATCLSCPLPRCRYDEPGGRRQLLNSKRNSEIQGLRRERGLAIRELAARYGVSARTVHRILRKEAM